MRDETCIPVMMRLIGEGCPVILTGRFAVLLVLPVVLLLAMMGVTAPADRFRILQEPVSAEPCGRIICMRGILPAHAGTAGRCSRAFLQE